MTMTVAAIDHVNLHVPADGLEDVLDFYGDRLGFEIENVDLFEAGEKGFVSARLTPTSIVHFQPRADFVPPTGNSYDHVALAVEEDVEQLKANLAAVGVEVEREIEALGATGLTPTVYFHDPFGYLLEVTVAEA